ncbi:AAA family ATPase [Nocardia beijingensis]|uniref:nucleotide-binding protein n=1 Tax=Nocardia beijingensis TaxID=95162 RepID=UPI002B4B92A7|nr:AAA family ATPase [Nocardia beijingensis]
MSRSNDGLPMLPPWLSESDVGQSGYEAPVQNLPHDELIEDTPNRRRGRFKNRAPEAERPEAARPEKRRKGWRRDKHDGPSDEEQRQNEANRAPAPGPDEPAPGPFAGESRQQQPSYDRPTQVSQWQAPPQHHSTPQHGLPTRNPSQPSPGFQPLGSRSADPAAPNDRQAGRPDLPPPPPRQQADERPTPAPGGEHARPPRGESAPGPAAAGRPPAGPQHSGWPSTGNPRLDAALSAVLPNHWPAPGQAAAPAAPGPARHDTAHPGSGSPGLSPTGPTRTWPTGDRPAGPTGAATSGPLPGHPATSPSGPGHAARQSGHTSTPTGAQFTPPADTTPATPTTGPGTAGTTSTDHTARQSGPSTSDAQVAPLPGSDPAAPTTRPGPAGTPTGASGPAQQTAPGPSLSPTGGAPAETPSAAAEHNAWQGGSLYTGALPTSSTAPSSAVGGGPAAGAPTGQEHTGWQASDPRIEQGAADPSRERPGFPADEQTRRFGEPTSTPGEKSSASDAAAGFGQAGSHGATSAAASPGGENSAGQPHGGNTAAAPISDAAQVQQPTASAAGTSGTTPSPDASQSSRADHSAASATDTGSGTPSVEGSLPPHDDHQASPTTGTTTTGDTHPTPHSDHQASPTTGTTTTGDTHPTPHSDHQASPTPGTTTTSDTHPTPQGDDQASAAQTAASDSAVVSSDGPPPWLAASRSEQAEVSATDAPRRLPPLPDPPAPHERPQGGALTPAQDEHRPPTRGADGPPPWLGHAAAPETGRPHQLAPHDAAAQADRAPADSAPVPADQPPAAHPRLVDHGAGEPTAATGPHREQGAVLVPPAPHGGFTTGAAPTAASASDPAAPSAGPGSVDAARAQIDAGIPTPGWTSANDVGAAPARTVGGRHRLSADPNDRSAPHASIEQAPRFDQQPVPPQGADPAYSVDGPQPGPQAASGMNTGHATQFADFQMPGAAPHAPVDQWSNAAAPESGPVAPHSGPLPYPAEQRVAGQPTPQWGTPSGYAQPPGAQFQQPSPDYPQPPAQHPGAQFHQPSLDNVPLRRAKKAPAGSGWRKAVHHVSGGAINPGMSAEERRLQELVARIRQPVRGDYRIAVLSLKGGVGKTTTTMGLGSTFASIRGDRVIAVDANPDFGTLSQRVPLQTRSTVRDLLLDSTIQRYSDVRRHTSQATSRLEVLASERDPAASEAFSEEEYRAVARILQRFYNIILTDCGTGLMHSAMAGVLDLAHSLVLISSPAIDGARSAAATLDWLSLHGHDHLVRNAVVVINSPRAGSPNVGIQQLREYFLSRCRAVHIIPFDPHMSEGAEIDLHRLHKQTKRAYVELAATVADDFATDHRRYRP